MVIIFNIRRRRQANHEMIHVPPIVYGIGPTRTRKAIIKTIGRIDLKLHSINYKILHKIETSFKQNKFLMLKVLKEKRFKNLRRLKKIRCYRGIRLIQYLPSRGQRTRSNGITPRFLGSGSFDYIPTGPAAHLKRIAHYIRRTPLLKKISDQRYHKLLRQNFNKYKAKQPKAFAYGIRRGQLGIFTKLLGVKRAKPVKAKKAKVQKRKFSTIVSITASTTQIITFAHPIKLQFY